MDELPHVVCPWDHSKEEILDFSPLKKSQLTASKRAMGVRKQSLVPLSKSFVVIFRKTNLPKREGDFVLADV